MSSLESERGVADVGIGLLAGLPLRSCRCEESEEEDVVEAGGAGLPGGGAARAERRIGEGMMRSL